MKKFRDPGVLITEDGGCEVEIKSRVQKAREVFTKKRESY